MPRKKGQPQQELLPDDWQPTQAVDEPVINSPYEEPLQHWVYKDGNPFLEARRRPASYWYKTKRTGEAQAELFAEEERDELPLINRLRDDVKRWRDAGYRGASPVTKDLLNWWIREDRPRRLFFCQREAVETIIYLLEFAIPGRLSRTGYRNFEIDSNEMEKLLSGEKPSFTPEENEDFFPRLIDQPADEALLALRRLGCKMATGSGKTIVMAMIITWAFCNRGRNPATKDYPNAVLVCAPNLTVKNRLQVLRPDHEDNYYDEFDLVPAKYRELLNAGKVLVTNWHGFAPKSEHREGDTSYKVVNKGEETADAFTKDRLGELSARLPILVLNDEGHHCWRPKTVDAKPDEGGVTTEEKNALKEEAEEARVWLTGLDRINNAGLIGEGNPCVLTCVDLSATPFYLSNSGYPEGSPFPWLVSDFGLIDAIESGIVKIPRLPVDDETKTTDDAGRPDPKFYRLWEHIKADLKPADKYPNRRPKPDPVYREAQSALVTLASQWKKRLDDIEDKSPGEAIVPPVLIVVCDNTEISEVFFEKISGEKTVEVPSEDGKKTIKQVVYGESQVLPELANKEGLRRTIRIDSKLLAKAESEEGESKDKAAMLLREIIDTVGKKGAPGEHIRCVVSVSMLTEGWDANNVTHILGIRAFGSQLLCEQVVGRGLRRMNYIPEEKDGKLLLPAEYVDVYGIPFSLIPFKGKSKDSDKPDPVYHHIFPLEERESFEIRIPVVEGYTYDLKGSGIVCDVDKLEGFIVNNEPTRVYLVATKGYQDTPDAVSHGDFVEQDREEFYKSIRFQQIVFRLAQMVGDDLIQKAEGRNAEQLKNNLLARHQIFPELVRIIKQYIDKKVKFANGVDRRELALDKYANLLKERIRDGITADAASDEAPLLPIINSFKPYQSTADVDYRTTKPVVPLTKSHLNLLARDSGWEQEAVEKLEDMDFVECYTPNDRNIGLTIHYEYQGNPHIYEPDFIVRLRSGKLIIVEIKGGKGEVHDEDRVPAKNTAAKKWVSAINNAKRYGEWAFEICKDLNLLKKILESHIEADDSVVLPFKTIDNPSDQDRYKTCVPLASLRAAAGHWSEEQANIEEVGEWAEEWVAFDSSTKFEPGMFVAKIQGQSMEPEIPDGSYCLFRPPSAGTRQNKKLLVWHSGVTDPHTGGQYTLKVYTSEKSVDPDSEWQHTRIILKPLNPTFEPIVLTPEDENEVGIIAEFVEVVGV